MAAFINVECLHSEDLAYATATSLCIFISFFPPQDFLIEMPINTMTADHFTCVVEVVHIGCAYA
jgi:hypothetical protein